MCMDAIWVLQLGGYNCFKQVCGGLCHVGTFEISGIFGGPGLSSDLCQCDTLPNL